jgi:hypothetical protein
MANLILTTTFLEVFVEIPARDQLLIAEKVEMLQTFPDMYPVDYVGPEPFLGMRHFVAGNWHV